MEVATNSMRWFKHKKAGYVVRATPWWEPLTVMFDEKFYNELVPEMKLLVGDRKLAHGALVQVGWLIENEGGVWIGVNLTAEKSFDDLGEVKLGERRPRGGKLDVTVGKAGVRSGKGGRRRVGNPKSR